MYGGLLLAAPVAPRVVLSLLAAYDADRERLGFELAQFAGQLAPLVAPHPLIAATSANRTRSAATGRLFQGLSITPLAARFGQDGVTACPEAQAGAGARGRRSDSTCSTSAISTCFVESRRTGVAAEHRHVGRDRQRLPHVVRRRGTARRRSS